MIPIYIDPMGSLHSSPGTPDQCRYRIPREGIGITHFRGIEVVTDRRAEAERWVDLYRTPVLAWPNRLQLALVLCLAQMERA